MKMKKLLGAAIPLMLLVGCNLNSTVGNNNKSVETAKPIEKVKVSKEEYPKKLMSLREEFNKTFDAFKSSMSSDKPKKEKTKKALEKLDELQKVTDKFRAIEAPSEYKETQGNIEKSMDLFSSGIKLIHEAINKNSNTILDKGKDKFNEADKYWNKAYTSIADDIKVGDGTITAQDLIELDKAAGIDVNSVTQNVSRDGKELVGTWGFKNSDGSFNVSIILSKDGKYEGYKNGKYPSKTDYLNGTWKYDADRRTLHIHNDETYTDGKLSTDGRADMPMQIQYFDNKEMQLLDQESLATFRYEKKN